MSTAVLPATTPATANQLLAIAEQTLLTPYNLSASGLAQVFGTLNAHRIDDADVYFQYTRSEGWSLEEGIVKAGSFSIDQGVGVRAIAGEKTAFAYSDEISTAALGDAARATRAIAKAGQSRRAYVPGQLHETPSRYLPTDPIASLPAAAKVALLEKLERRARALDPRVVQVMASLAAEYEVVLLSLIHI